MTRTDIVLLVGRLLGAPISELSDVRRVPLDYDAFLAGRSLTRIQGRARVGERESEWSMIEKRTEGPAIAFPYLYDNGRREFLAYQSEVLNDLAPGLSAPTAYGIEEDGQGGLTLWLEDLGDRRAWDTAGYQDAARRLGRLAGRWLERVPRHDWLFEGWIERHSQTAALEAGLGTISAAIGDARLESRLGRSLSQSLDLLRRQARYREVLERLPTTLCHHDAVRSNLFQRGGETVLIDWEMVGPGPVGADLASLLFSSVRRGDLSASRLAELKPAMLEAYSQGVAEGGGRLAERDVRLGYAASVALRWTLVRDIVAAVRGDRPVWRGSARAEPPEAALDELSSLATELWAAADTVQELAAL